MINVMNYKGYTGNVEFSEQDGILFGKVLGVKALISYEGSSVAELISDFHDAIDRYLAVCAEKEEVPERPYKGSFNVRISPDLHRKAAVYAMTHNTSLNHFIELCVEEKLAGIG